MILTAFIRRPILDVSHCLERAIVLLDVRQIDINKIVEQMVQQVSFPIELVRASGEKFS